MKRPAAVALALALLAMTASGARAGDKSKVKREYHTPYGKVKVKEYYHRNPAPYYYGAPPVYGPAYYAPPAFDAPPPAYYPPYCPGTYYNPAPYPYGAPYKVKIDD